MDEKVEAKSWHLSAKEMNAYRKTFLNMRRGLRISQIALAKQAGLSSDKLARWEKGKAKLNPEEMFKLSEALDAAVIANVEANPAPQIDSGSRALKSLRRQMGLTQKQLARLIGLAQSSISIAENGYAPLSPEEMSKVEKVFDSWVAKHPELNRTISLKQLAAPTFREESQEKKATPQSGPMMRLASLGRDTSLSAAQQRIEELESLIEADKGVIEAYKRVIEADNRLIEALKRCEQINNELIEAYADGLKEVLGENSELQKKVSEIEKKLQDEKMHATELTELLGLETEAALARNKADEFREKLKKPVTAPEGGE